MASQGIFSLRLSLTRNIQPFLADLRNIQVLKGFFVLDIDKANHSFGYYFIALSFFGEADDGKLILLDVDSLEEISVFKGEKKGLSSQPILNS